MRGMVIAVVALLGFGPRPVGAAEMSLERLAWLAGTWEGVSDGVRMEETWSTPAGGGLVGMHKDTRGGKMVSYEFFRIVPQKDGRVCYMASQLGRAPVPFCAAAMEDSAVVFENLQHDYPQRVLYRLLADGRLHARIEGPQAGRTVAMEWWWTRRGGR